MLQFVENLTDRQAARAVACRIDWKYALGMRLVEPGFDRSVLSEFRNRLAEGDRADQLLAVMADRLAAAGLIKRRGRQRTDSTHVLAAVRKLSRIELVGETMRVALEAVASVDEKWLAALLTPEWAQRYGQPVGYQRMPAGAAALAEYVLQVGADGMALLQAVYRDGSPPALQRLAEVEVLRQVWSSSTGMTTMDSCVGEKRKLAEPEEAGKAHHAVAGAAITMMRSQPQCPGPASRS